MPKNIKKSNDEFLKEVKNQVGDEYTFLEEYINTNTPLKVKHNLCGNIYNVTPNTFLNKKCRCRKCITEFNAKNRRKSNDEFLKEIKNQVGDEYTFLEEYINDKTKLKVKHNLCGNVYFVTPNNFVRAKRRCPFCCKRNTKRTNDEFLKEVKDHVGDEYTFLEEYINTDKPLKIKHNKCNKIYKVAPKEFLCNKARCPYCGRKIKNSIYCKEIEKFLIKNNISFEDEEHCNEFSTSKSFDFVIQSNIFLEFDGKQHFELSFSNTPQTFNEQLARDKEKFDFFINNNKYSLIRISYKNRKILDKILAEFFINSSTTIEKINDFDNILYIKNGKIIIKKGDYENLYI